MPVKHIVLFQFKADASPESVKEAFEGMLGLKGACIHPTSQKPYIKSLSGGRDNSKEGMQAGIQYGFVVEFDNLEDRDYYVEKDEAHEAFKNSARPIIEKVIVVDYSF